MLKVEGLSKPLMVKTLNNISFTINTGDKVVLLGRKMTLLKTTFAKILAGELEGTLKHLSGVQLQHKVTS